ncbi:DUF1992 domain-containing protein [Burkholderiaceae bacterium FT117]|uniref:DnaJ family domain-containing protein n=1 Tax=Zeimonas sediminis TaxID=2944268 RepID=UPI002342E4B9|nr:DnaJ family domain-containing protein [Zeimonas sediminis]MCM5570206.1 DUF1992 domain-containing protein [Zeimonas sediminis]
MFAAFNELIEQRIDEARRQGAFDDLPGAGRPLDLDDDRMVPEELRVAYRILKNAGFVPPEVEALRDLDSMLRIAVDGADDSPESRRAGRKIVALAMALEARGAALTTGAGLEYRRALLERFDKETK